MENFGKRHAPDDDLIFVHFSSGLVQFHTKCIIWEPSILVALKRHVIVGYRIAEGNYLE
jgi:hypothetical protein